MTATYDTLRLRPEDDPHRHVAKALALLEAAFPDEADARIPVEAVMLLKKECTRFDDATATAVLALPVLFGKEYSEIATLFSTRVADILCEARGVVSTEQEEGAPAAMDLLCEADPAVRRFLAALRIISAEKDISENAGKSLTDSIETARTFEDGETATVRVPLRTYLSDAREEYAAFCKPLLGLTGEPRLEARMERALCAYDYKLNPPQQGFGQQMLFTLGANGTPPPAHKIVAKG